MGGTLKVNFKNVLSVAAYAFAISLGFWNRIILSNKLFVSFLFRSFEVRNHSYAQSLLTWPDTTFDMWNHTSNVSNANNYHSQLARYSSLTRTLIKMLFYIQTSLATVNSLGHSKKVSSRICLIQWALQKSYAGSLSLTDAFYQLKKRLYLNRTVTATFNTNSNYWRLA